jgi:hypothetical protein
LNQSLNAPLKRKNINENKKIVNDPQIQIKKCRRVNFECSLVVMYRSATEIENHDKKNSSLPPHESAITAPLKKSIR